MRTSAVEMHRLGESTTEDVNACGSPLPTTLISARAANPSVHSPCRNTSSKPNLRAAAGIDVQRIAVAVTAGKSRPVGPDHVDAYLVGGLPDRARPRVHVRPPNPPAPRTIVCDRATNTVPSESVPRPVTSMAACFPLSQTADTSASPYNSPLAPIGRSAQALRGVHDRKRSEVERGCVNP